MQVFHGSAKVTSVLYGIVKVPNNLRHFRVLAICPVRQVPSKFGHVQRDDSTFAYIPKLEEALLIEFIARIEANQLLELANILGPGQKKLETQVVRKATGRRRLRSGGSRGRCVGVAVPAPRVYSYRSS